ncbi:hypothetical protein [Bradyrhizobium brasilense]|nr:hypothetical protein [Bradyrhizobium brasilense]
MGRTAWSFGGLACSDACGEAASAAIDRVRQSTAYQDALRQKQIADSAMSEMMREAVKGAHKASRDRLAP